VGRGCAAPGPGLAATVRPAAQGLRVPTEQQRDWRRGLQPRLHGARVGQCARHGGLNSSGYRRGRGRGRRVGVRVRCIQARGHVAPAAIPSDDGPEAELAAAAGYGHSEARQGQLHLVQDLDGAAQEGP